ncbi:FadR/GntR family transcriptional regulator [Amycolatopsis sp. NPDC051903]|uniref:FadR/GntR family transcriptional regulator n=1 Tax=Amycolatopsis sp. NPDC051903 TaxID=3363936 RepID=UPI0037BDA015
MSSARTAGRLLPEQVASELITRILDGELDLDEQLPSEVDLAAALGISRLTLREAVKALQNRGVLRIERGRGTYVNPRRAWSQLDPMVLDAMTGSEAGPELFRHLTEMRRVVETGMAGLAAARRTDADLDRMRTHLDQLADAAGRDSVDDYATADLAFHDDLLAAAGNPLVEGIYDQLRSALRDLRRETTRMAQNLADGLAVHRAILDAVSAGDAEQATHAMMRHFERTSAYLEQAIAATTTRRAPARQ